MSKYKQYPAFLMLNAPCLERVPTNIVLCIAEAGAVIYVKPPTATLAYRSIYLRSWVHTPKAEFYRYWAEIEREPK